MLAGWLQPLLLRMHTGSRVRSGGWTRRCGKLRRLVTVLPVVVGMELSDEERAGFVSAPARLRLSRALAESYTENDIEDLRTALSAACDVIRATARPDDWVAMPEWAVRRMRLLRAVQTDLFGASSIARGDEPEEFEVIRVGVAGGVLDAEEGAALSGPERLASESRA